MIMNALYNVSRLFSNSLAKFKIFVTNFLFFMVAETPFITKIFLILNKKINEIYLQSSHNKTIPLISYPSVKRELRIKLEPRYEIC